MTTKNAIKDKEISSAVFYYQQKIKERRIIKPKKIPISLIKPISIFSLVTMRSDRKHWPLS
jgi:hypothetical protein